MPSASGILTGVRLVSESSFGVASGTTFDALRFTETSLNDKKDIYKSQEIRADRAVADLRHGMEKPAGDINVELGLSTYDKLLEGALSGTFAAVTTGSTNLSASAPSTYGRSAGSFVADGFLPGDELLASGFTTAANNGRTKVVSVAPTALVVEKATLVNEAEAAARTVALVGKRLKGGTTLKTFTVERAFADINQYLLFAGMAVDSLKLVIKPEQIITAAFAFLGKSMTASGVSAASVVTAAAANGPFDAFRGVLQEAGGAVAYATGLEINLSNGRGVKGNIGSQTPQEVHEGQLSVTGTLTAFFQNLALLNKFKNETESSLDVRLDDPNGTDFHRVRVPRLKYTSAEFDNPREGPVMGTFAFEGLADSASGTSIIYQRSNA